MGIEKVKIDKNNFIWDKISNTAAGAASGDGFIPESKIIKNEWGKNGELEFQKRDDGTYLISDNGVALGFTDKASAESIINAKVDDNSKTPSIGDLKEEYYENKSENEKSNETPTKTLTDIENEMLSLISGEVSQKTPEGIKGGENDNSKAPSNVSSVVKDQTVNYKSPEYQKKLEEAVEKFNQVDGVVSEYLVQGCHFRDVGCGTASIMHAYAMLSGDDNFNPEEFVQDAIDQGYLSNSGSVSTILPIDSDSNTLRQKWGIEATAIENSPESIIQALKDGKKVMFNIYPNSGYYATEAGHYVLLDHYDEATNQIYVFDPAAREGCRPVERMGYHDVDFLQENMFNHQNNAPLAIEYNK